MNPVKTQIILFFSFLVLLLCPTTASSTVCGLGQCGPPKWYQQGFFPPDQTAPVHSGLFASLAMAQGIATQISVKDRWPVLVGFLHPKYDKWQQDAVHDHDILQLWTGVRKSFLLPRNLVASASVLTGFGRFLYRYPAPDVHGLESIGWWNYFGQAGAIVFPGLLSDDDEMWFGPVQ